MSADCRTEHFSAYYHDDHVAVFENGQGFDGDMLIGAFTPELVAELQSITDQWKASRPPTSPHPPLTFSPSAVHDTGEGQ